MYQSLTVWRDLTDGHLYKPDETFPHDGGKVPAERIESLLNGKNKAGIALIRLVEDQPEQKPVEKAEAPKRATRSRKKTV